MFSSFPSCCKGATISLSRGGGGWKTSLRQIFFSVDVKAGFFFTLHLKPDIFFPQRIGGQILKKK